MSNQLSIQPGQAVFGTDAPTSGAVPAKPQVQAQAVTVAPMFVNPSFQFDPTVGLVVSIFATPLAR